MSAPQRGGLRYIPTVAFGTDLVLITFSVFAAILGRETIPFPMLRARRDVGHSLDVAGPVMIIGWVAAIFLLGGYRPQVFGAGLDEYKSTDQRLAARPPPPSASAATCSASSSPAASSSWPS